MPQNQTNIYNQAVEGELRAEMLSSRITTKLQSFDNVKPGDTAVLRINPGLTYEKLMFKLTDMIPEDMLNVKLKVGTKVIQSYKNGGEIAFLNRYYKRVEEAGYLTLHNVRAEMNNLAQRDRFAIATLSDDLGAKVTSFTIEFEVKVNNPAQTPKIEAYAVQTPARSGVGRDIVKVRRVSSLDLVAGENEITSIPALAHIMGIHFLTNKIEKIELLSDTTKVFDATREIMQITQKQAKYARVPQTNATHMDWCLTGTPSSAIRAQGVVDFRFKVTTSEAVIADVLIEYIDPIHGLV